LTLKDRGKCFPIFEVASFNNEPIPREGKKNGWGTSKTKQPKQCLA
jgi:hypothetical protein